MKRALYGLKQAPRAWNKRIDSYLIKLGFNRCSAEHGVYTRKKNGKLIIVYIYVDDLLVTGSDMKEIDEFKRMMNAEFEMTDLGTLSYFLGIEFVQCKEGVFMHQKKYVTELLKKFNMFKCNEAMTPTEVNLKVEAHKEEKPVNGTLYKQIVGSLRYVCNSRPDISFVVGVASRFMSDPRVPHLIMVKRVLRYLKGTMDYGILFPNRSEESLTGFADSDWCGNKVDSKSTTGFIFRYAGAPISWCSKKQPNVALSTWEAEYMAATYAACQAKWLGELCDELQLDHRKPLQLFVDNKSAIDLAKDPIAHGRSKHIEARFHFLRDEVNKDKIELIHCSSERQQADFLTKSLSFDKFLELRDMIGILSLGNLN